MLLLTRVNLLQGTCTPTLTPLPGVHQRMEPTRYRSRLIPALGVSKSSNSHIPSPRIPRSILEGAYLRCKRVKAHIDELERELDEYEAQERSAVFAEINSETKITSIGFTRAAAPPPKNTNILIGEVIYNLRAALDYMVYEMAIFDSGQPQEHTQFPIVTDSKNFSPEAKKSLKGISLQHIAEIEVLQPFSGCNWTAELRDLSNPDKHRHLVPAVGNGEHLFRIKRTESGFETEFKPQIVTTFDDNRPVINTLRNLRASVIDVLDGFSSP
jgi:hypothetical protein